jgi:hypothetical protein
MNNTVLVTGCSYTQESVWPSALFPKYQIINLGRAGAGNRYISNSVINLIDINFPPDFVFILFSGVNRSEVLVPNNHLTKPLATTYKYYGEIRDTLYFFSGGNKWTELITRGYNNIKDQSHWPIISSPDEFLNLPTQIKQECLEAGLFNCSYGEIEQCIHDALMINYFSNISFLQTQTYLSIINCQTFLEKHNIPYMFSFFYNPFDLDYATQFGCLDRTHHLHKVVNWDKFINCFPFETGLKFNLLEEDEVHLTTQGQLKWANQITKKINKKIIKNEIFDSGIFKFLRRN